MQRHYADLVPKPEGLLWTQRKRCDPVTNKPPTLNPKLGKKGTKADAKGRGYKKIDTIKTKDRGKKKPKTPKAKDNKLNNV
jgi:hypothetical protein